MIRERNIVKIVIVIFQHLGGLGSFQPMFFKPMLAFGGLN